MTHNTHEEPDFRNDDVARCIRCGDIHDIEDMTTNAITGDSLCAECQEIFVERKAAQRAEEQSEGMGR